MPGASTLDLVSEAYSAGRGIGSFNVVQLEHAEGYVIGAERARLPVILQLSENTVRYHGAIAPVGRAMLEIADLADIPVAVHFDHATDLDLIHQAISLGFSSVMFDGSHLPYKENIEEASRVVALCHQRGVWVEAELGEIGGKDGVHHPDARTDPQEAEHFVDGTGVDALAVAVGSSHAMADRTASLDHALIEQLRSSLRVPLVLHGSSGAPDDELQRAVTAGITKVNVATHFNQAMTARVRETLAANPDLTDPRRYLGPSRTAIADRAADMLVLLSMTEAKDPGT